MGLPDFLKFAVRSAPDALVPLTSSSTSGRLVFDYVLIDATNAAQTIGFDQLFELLTCSTVSIQMAIVFAVDSQRDRTGTARHQRQSRVTVSDLDVKVQEFCSRLKRAFASRDACPQLLVSGRGVAGEADYKILDIHRSIVSFALLHHKRIPSFLFVSEDSDILCGTLCGPAPHTVSIATSLHDTTFKLHILRLSHVTTYVAACVDALASENGAEESGTTSVDVEVALPHPPTSCVEEDSTVVRRRKKDGPMIATGVRVELTDSDSDDDVEDANQSTALPGIISPHNLIAGWITYSSCVDLVFLFHLIMGNGVNVPPLVRGVTKVDVQSCWGAYCRNKYATGTPNGRNLLRVASSHSADLYEATLEVDCKFLYAILESVHYTDCVSRPPVGDEKERAVDFLSNAVYGTLRYIVGCNIEGGSSKALKDTFLDSRPSTSAPAISPSLTATTWVLNSTEKLSFKFPLNSKPASEENNSSELGSGASRTIEIVDVGSHLVAPSVSNSWAVRGSGSKNFTVYELLQKSFLAGVKSDGKISVARRLFSSQKSFLSSITNPPAEYQQNTSVMGAIVVNWALTVSEAVSKMRVIGASTRFLSPATGNLVLGPVKKALTSSTKANDAKKMRMTYSFEFRRMMPLMDEENEAPKESQSQQTLFKALGVSLEYATAPTRPIVRSEEEHEIPKKKRVRVEMLDGAKAKSTEVSHESTQSAQGIVSKKSKRPGKKERMKRKSAAINDTAT